MKLRQVMLLVLAGMTIVAGRLAFPQQAEAGSTCLIGSCDPSGAKQRMFGPRLGDGDVTTRGYDNSNDIYNQRHQERYRSGIKAKPFDFGSSTDPLNGSLMVPRSSGFNDDRPDARSEHVRWCLKRYHSYAVESNTYVTYQGRTRYCQSPFN